MKTLEEIKKHLSTTVYDEDSKHKIAGFLISKEIGKEEGILDIEFAFPESFEDFEEWFNKSSKDYFQRKNDIVNDGKVFLKNELKNEKSGLKIKVYQDGRYFDMTYDEILSQLKDFKPVICEGIVDEYVIEKLYNEFFVEKEPKYKYVGEERENLIKYREKFQYAISELKNEYTGSLINNECFSSLIYRAYIDNYTRCLKNIEDKLNETVD